MPRSKNLKPNLKTMIPKRYKNVDGQMVEHPRGEYVLYIDYINMTKKSKASIQALEGCLGISNYCHSWDYIPPKEGWEKESSIDN